MVLLPYHKTHIFYHPQYVVGMIIQDLYKKQNMNDISGVLSTSKINWVFYSWVLRANHKSWSINDPDKLITLSLSNKEVKV
jgi:hypothetical protein